MGAAAGDASHGEPLDAEVVGQRRNVVRPINKRPVWLGVRDAVARTLGEDEPDAVDLGDGVSLGKDKAGAGRAVEEEEGAPPFVSEFRVAETPAVRERDGAVALLFDLWHRSG